MWDTLGWIITVNVCIICVTIYMSIKVKCLTDYEKHVLMYAPSNTNEWDTADLEEDN